MKIAMIGQKGIPALSGGIERHVEELSIHLAGLGHSVYIYTRPWYQKKLKACLEQGRGVRNSKFEIQNYKGVNLISLPSIHTKHLDTISHTLFASIHALFQNYDIIHYHGVGPALLCWIPRIFKPKTKVVATFHCRDSEHKKWGRFARMMLRLGERINCRAPHQTIAVSRTLQKYCKEKFNKETIYIPNGVSDKIIREYAQINSRLISDFNLEPQKYILMVSRLVKHKGVHYLIEAFKSLISRMKLVIVGDGTFTDDYVKSLKEATGEDENIIFTGPQHGKTLEALFRNAYVLVNPSEAEGLSTTILEAMAYGVPVLASDISENMELVKDYGWYFKNKDVNDLRNKIEYLIAHPALIKEKAEKAREFVLNNYNWSDIVLQIEKLYAGVLVKEEIIEWIRAKVTSTANLLR
jgi:glycosyltransferase involved in cell wall biosynthesis